MLALHASRPAQQWLYARRLADAPLERLPLPPADKQTFPQQDVVGWYATGTEISDADMAIQRKVGCRVVHGDTGCAGHAGAAGGLSSVQQGWLWCSEAGSG